MTHRRHRICAILFMVSFRIASKYTETKHVTMEHVTIVQIRLHDRILEKLLRIDKQTVYR